MKALVILKYAQRLRATQEHVEVSPIGTTLEKAVESVMSEVTRDAAQLATGRSLKRKSIQLASPLLEDMARKHKNLKTKPSCQASPFKSDLDAVSDKTSHDEYRSPTSSKQRAQTTTYTQTHPLEADKMHHDLQSAKPLGTDQHKHGRHLPSSNLQPNSSAWVVGSARSGTSRHPNLDLLRNFSGLEKSKSIT
jgi:hypothetical protein